MQKSQILKYWCLWRFVTLLTKYVPVYNKMFVMVLYYFPKWLVKINKTEKFYILNMTFWQCTVINLADMKYEHAKRDHYLIASLQAATCTCTYARCHFCKLLTVWIGYESMVCIKKWWSTTISWHFLANFFTRKGGSGIQSTSSCFKI